MKSRYTDMLEVWECLSFDGNSLCAMPISEHVRDIARVRTGAETRGQAFFLLDLPTLDGHLTNLLEFGEVRFQGPLTARKSKVDSRPRFLWAYWARVCDQNGCLLEEPDVDAMAAIRQLSCFFKKYETECSPERVEKTVKEYIKHEQAIVAPTLSWESDVICLDDVPSFTRNFARPALDLLNIEGTSAEHGLFLQRLDKVAGVIVSAFGAFDSMSEDSKENGYFRHGPGAVSNLKGKAYKYDPPSWSEKLEGVFPFDWCSGAGLGEAPRSRREFPSRLLAVPKTAKAPRLIAAEPVEHQFCQQKVLSWLDHRISATAAGWFLDLHNQTLSQSLVAKASIDRSLCTIDLSSASDLVSCRHVESLLRSNRTLLEAAHACRTRYLRDDVAGSGFMKLKKFASMGSALTFPIESIFFLCVALASAGAEDARSIARLRGKVRIFGDDIIVPNDAYNQLVSNLTFLGLKVNQEKSFSRGYFREACGKDCWRGFDITPARPKTTLAGTARGVQSLIDTSNNLHKRGYWRAAERLLQIVPWKYRRAVFSHKRAVPGLFTYGQERIGHVQFCNRLHINYVRVPTFVKKSERIALDSSITLREFFTRPWSETRPRELGVMRREKAVMAFSRVEVLPLSS